MTVPSRVPLTEVIDALRNINPDAKRIATVAQLRLVVDDVRRGLSVRETLNRPELAGFTHADLLTIVEEFGKHRARVRKQSAIKAAPVAVDVAGGGALFGYDRAMLDSLGQAVSQGLDITVEHLAEAPAHLFTQSRVLGLRTVPDSSGAAQVTDVLGYDEVAGADRFTVKQLVEAQLLPADFDGRGSTSLYLMWTRTPAAPLSLADRSGQQEVLSANPPELIEKLAAAQARSRARRGSGKTGRSRTRAPRFAIPEWLRSDGVEPCAYLKHSVIVPDGYAKSATQPRDIGKSLAAVAVDPVGDDELIRFEMTQHPLTAKLTADHIGVLHWFVRHDLAYKLLEFGGLAPSDYPDSVTGEHTMRVVGEPNVGLCTVMVEAFDLLDVARTDALDALTVLLTGDRAEHGTLRAAARTCRWLAPGEIGRIEQLLDELISHPDRSGLQRLLEQRLAGFGRLVAANPSTFALTGVEQLTLAHVTQIKQAAGLLTDEAEEKAVRAELRARLTDMGFVNDLDREIPKGIDAWRDGKLAEFYASRQARADGDPDWRALLETDAEVDAEEHQFA